MMREIDVRRHYTKVITVMPYVSRTDVLSMLEPSRGISLPCEAAEAQPRSLLASASKLPGLTR